MLLDIISEHTKTHAQTADCMKQIKVTTEVVNMYMYELFLARDINGKSIHFIETDHKVDDLEIWLKKLVKDNTITEDIANAVTFVW